MMERRPGIVYLAAPYSHPDPEVRRQRYEMATAAAADLAASGFIVFSPLTMTHPIDRILAATGETLGSDHWVSYDEAFMAVCSEIKVLKLNGWQKSSGVASEITFFASRGLPVTFIEPDDVLAAVDVRKIA